MAVFVGRGIVPVTQPEAVNAVIINTNKTLLILRSLRVWKTKRDSILPPLFTALSSVQNPCGTLTNADFADF
jgi:hypothetical protein